MRIVVIALLVAFVFSLAPSRASAAPVGGAVGVISFPGQQFLYDRFQDMVAWLGDCAQFISDIIGDGWTAIRDYWSSKFYDLWNWATQYAKDSFGVDLNNYADTVLGSFNYLQTVFHTAMACLPIVTVVGIFFTALAISATVRLIRWVKSFIPTVGD